MIRRRPAIRQLTSTGAFFILVAISSACAGFAGEPATAPADSTGPTPAGETLGVDDLRRLGDRLDRTGDDFASYLFKLAAYHLSEDRSRKLRLGEEIVDLCLHRSRFPEAERMIRTIAADFPDRGRYHDDLTYRFGYTLILTGEHGMGDLYLRSLQEKPRFRDRVLLLRAKPRLVEARPEEARRLLARAELESSAYADTVSALVDDLATGPRFGRRSPVVAGALSAILPGAGQMYSGHHFDALQSFLFNLVLGGAAYLAWNYDVADRAPDDRRYTFPVFSTAVWSVFYVANIWGASSAATRYNRYHEMAHYDDALIVIDRMLADRDFFLSPVGRDSLSAR